MTTQADVVAEARSWVGVPFHHQGRSRTGVDCIGVPVCVSRALHLGLEDYDRTDYPRQPNGQLVAALRRVRGLIEIAVDQRQPGDLMVLAWGRHGQHIGVMVDQGRMVHAYENTDPARVVCTRLNGGFARTLRACFRFRALAGGEK